MFFCWEQSFLKKNSTLKKGVGKKKPKKKLLEKSTWTGAKK